MAEKRERERGRRQSGLIPLAPVTGLQRIDLAWCLRWMAVFGIKLAVGKLLGRFVTVIQIGRTRH